MGQNVELFQNLENAHENEINVENNMIDNDEDNSSGQIDFE